MSPGACNKPTHTNSGWVCLPKCFSLRGTQLHPCELNAPATNYSKSINKQCIGPPQQSPYWSNAPYLTFQSWLGQPQWQALSLKPFRCTIWNQTRLYILQLQCRSLQVRCSLVTRTKVDAHVQLLHVCFLGCSPKESRMLWSMHTRIGQKSTKYVYAGLTLGSVPFELRRLNEALYYHQARVCKLQCTCGYTNKHL